MSSPWRKLQFGFQKINYLSGIILLLAVNLMAQTSVLTGLKEFIPEELKFAGFRIDNQQTVSIEAAGMEPDYPFRHASMSQAWILNSNTREVVWNLGKADEVENAGKLSTFEDEVDLQPGTYEVYFSTYFYYPDHWENSRFSWKYHRGFFSRLFHKIFDDDDYYRERFDWDLFNEFYIKVNGNGQSFTEEDIVALNESQWKNTLIAHTQLKNNIFKKEFLKVEKPVELQVNALGEATHDGDYDFGKIVDYNTRKVIWQLDYRNSDYAGGADKNRMSRENITLQPGEYSVLYVTDDSHAYRRWNAAPPFDPLNWGLTIMLADSKDAQNIKLTDFEEISESRKILEFKEMGDNDYISTGFALKKELDLYIYAIGEGRDDEMYDFGRIIDAKTREEVWKMEYDETESAGGSEKNRLFDKIIHFKPGDYIAYFLTDDSHSYNDWNASPPYDPEHWGMTIYVNDKNYAQGDFTEYDMEDDENILIRLTKVGDYEKKHRRFFLAEDGMVHIYAVGEGTYGGMYDYAWIEDANSGKVVWEMTYRMTDRAGGARKNRVYNDSIHLDKGEYEVYYETDDSHSFEEWNDAPPDDPGAWGITIYYANNKN